MKVINANPTMADFKLIIAHLILLFLYIIERFLIRARSKPSASALFSSSHGLHWANFPG